MCGTGFFSRQTCILSLLSYICAALSPKINIPQATQAKINIFCVEFQELSNGALTCQLIVCGTLFFSRQMCIFGFSTKKIVKSDLQATCYSNVYQSSKMPYFSARNLGMQFKLRFYYCTQCRRDAVFGKTKCTKRPIQNFVGDLFPHRGKCCGFVQEFRY